MIVDCKGLSNFRLFTKVLGREKCRSKKVGHESKKVETTDLDYN